MSELLEIAGKVAATARALGAEESSVTVSQGWHTTIQRRAGKVEQATQATTRGLVVSLLVDGRYSSHSTSDLRDEALGEFLARAVAATRFLEPDPDRALPPLQDCGRGASEAALDQWDPAWGDRTAEERAADSVRLEQEVAARRPPQEISSAVYVADGASHSARVMSNGFADEHRGAWFAAGGEMTLSDEGGRRPEASAYYSARHLADLPDAGAVAQEVHDRAVERLGARPIASGSYPMLLSCRVAGRLLGALLGPMSGASLHEGRSCLAGKIGQRIGSDLLTVIDDPLRPRGLASRPWDGDGLTARPITVIEKGVLREYYLPVYYGRKLGMAPTTGGRSNWIVPSGSRSFEAMAADLPNAILVDGFLGGNSNSVTGDFSFGIRGLLYEHGKPTQALGEMNVSGNLLTVFDRLVEVGADVWPYSSVYTGTLLFDAVQFSGT